MALNLGSASATIDLNIAGFVNNAKAAGDSMNQLQNQSTKVATNGGLTTWLTSNSQHLNTLGTGLSIFGAAAVGTFAIAGNSAMNFEAAMSSVQAVTGATAEQFDALSDAALRIGKDTSFSATEAAMAIEELAKAGVSVEDILNGAADGAVALAEATGINMPQAATAMANAMNIFGLSGDEATRVANVFAAAANKSATDVTQLQAGLAQGGATFAMFGMSIEESIGLLAMFSDYGISGSDAATSISAALRHMSSGAGESGKAMQELGIQMYDANGQFVGMDSLAQQLNTTLGHMSEEERNLYLQRLGGADGMRSLNILYNEGADGVNEYTDAITGTNAAEEAAAARMDNLKGSIEELKGTVETLAITFMSRLTPVIRRVVDGISGVLQVFLRLPGPIQTAAAAIVGITGGLALLTGGGILAAVKIAELASAFKLLTNSPTVIAGVTNALSGLRVALLAVFTNPAILIGIAAIGLAIAAYKTNFLGFGDLIDSTIGKLRDFFGFTPDTKHATLDIGTAADVEYSDWVQMPDGTWKSTTLDITATGSGPAFVTKVEDASAADGWAYTISVDVDGDGKDDALKIIDSVDQGGGDYVMTATVDDEEYQVWYSETTGEAIVVEVDVQAPASERTANTLEQIMRWISQIKNITSGSFLQDWSNGAAKKIQEMADAFFDFAGMVTSFTWAKIQETDAFRWAEGKLDNLRTLIGYVQSAWNALFGGSDTNNDGRTSVGEQYGLDGPDLNQNGPAEDTGVTRTPRTPSLTKSDGASTPAGDIGSLAGLIANVEESYRRAVPAVSDFGNAIAGTSQPSQQAAIDNNLMASSVLPVGVNMQTADGQVKGASAGINSSFASIAASAVTNFTAAQAATVSNMGALASSAVSQAVTAGTGVATQFSTMATKTAASMFGMQAQSGVQLALMASTANTQGAAVNTNLTKGVTSAVSNSRSTLAQLSGIVAGAGANAAWQALMAGANIGNSFASGMESALGRIRSAANAMVSAAMTAVVAKAMIASPSKVFKRYGGYVGEGFEIGIRESYPAINRAAAGMVPGIQSPGFNAPMHQAYSGSTTVIDNSTSSVEYRYFSESDLKHMLETAESGPERAMDLLLTAQSRGTTK